ncbi:MAG: hypothetical protein PHW82_15005 [Bacteroidales bacterium]|nr:hypothetical protein [Bacteroidales bacterium]
MIERIKQIIDCEGVSISSFERIISASNGLIGKAIRNNSDIQSKWINSILENFPQYSAEWLVTGKGEMLKSLPGEENRNEMNEPYVNNYKNNKPEGAIQHKDFSKMLDIISRQQKTIEAQIRVIEELMKKKDGLKSNGNAACSA